MKKNCVDIKKINGNISKSSDGAFSNAMYNGKKYLTSIFLKNSISVSKFNNITKLKKIIVTNKKDLKKFDTINLI